MTGAAYSYTPGTGLALAGPRLAALVDLPPDAGLVGGLHEVIGGTGTVDEVLELLVTPGLRAVQHFALAEPTDEGLRVLVRGRYLVRAGGHTVESRGLWTDRIVQAEEFALVDPEADASLSLPLTGGGVVLAGRLTRSSLGTPVPPPAAAVAAEDVVAAAAASPAAVGRPGGSAPGSGAGGGTSTVTGPNGDGPHTRTEPGAPSVPAIPPVPLIAAAPLPSPPSPGTDTSSTAGAPTEPLPVAVRPSAPPATPSGSGSAGSASTPRAAISTGHTLPSPFTSPLADLPTPPAAAASSDPPTFVEALPWTGEDASADPGSVAAPLTPAAPSDAAERTLNRDALPRERPQLVVAARCPSGHLSPAYAGNCRVCGKPLPPQQPVEIPRPPLGVLRLSNGDTVVLDRGCILGRNPRVPSPLTGERPNLVKLIDPDKDISAQHLEVRLEYWHVAVQDLGSTNGTQVVLPGENPVTLRANDPLMIEPGTKVILAGVFSFTFEVTP